MEEKIYTNHNGEKITVSSLHTEHLLNALAKKMREVFEAENKDVAYKMINEINALKEEVYKRINEFVEKLGDTDGE